MDKIYTYCKTFSRKVVAGFKRLCSCLWGKSWFRIILQIVAWGLFHWIWFFHSSWRYFPDETHEFFSFYIIPIGIYIFYFFAYKQCYRKKYLYRFIAAGLLICWCAIALEYLYVIDPILKLVHPRPGKVSESYSFVVVKTLLDIALRDLALFSIVGFGLVFKDALEFVKLQKKELGYWQEKNKLQNEIQGYRMHEHFAGNLFDAYLGTHPESRQDLAECLYLYNFSARNNSQAFYPLKQEVEFAQRLIAFYEKIYPETPVRYEKKGKILAVYVLPMVTETLIGNMFKHGVTGTGSYMSVCFDFTDSDRIKMQFRNKVSPGQSFAKSPDSHGLDVLTRRLELAYGREAVLKWDFPENEVVATLTIPS